MEEKQALVSCIMPTYNRRQFVPNAIQYFLGQDYKNKELIIIDDGADLIEDLIPPAKNIRYYSQKSKKPLGTKLNMACDYAYGDVIVNWDDDDWYAPWRLSYQMAAMQEEGIELCGINNLLYYDLVHKSGHNYIYPANQRVWLAGSSQCYHKQLWQNNPFADINVGMDGLFVRGTPVEKVKVLADSSFAVHIIHTKNGSAKKTDGCWWHPFPIENIQQIIGNDWVNYVNGSSHSLLRVNEYKIAPVSNQPEKQKERIQNIFACLIHEKEECILDLVRNLHFHDPDSHILLYDGSDNPGLIKDKRQFEQFGVIWHPAPKPQQHGYLHGFALDCMVFAMDNLSFDTMTIVDSDLLCVRSGYSDYLANFLKNNPTAGLFSSHPERICPNSQSNFVASLAYKEIALWLPLLDSFPDGRSKFVHWTFWPSTVFVRNAIRDLLELFQENKMLHAIMANTKIWATEEVIFPTLVSLLGYEVVANPCSYDFVQFQKSYSQNEFNTAMGQEDVFWFHPVSREYDFTFRKQIRELNNNYSLNGRNKTHQNSTTPIFSILALLEKIEGIKGWFDSLEADLLISTTLKACMELTPPHTLVEVGSFQGKSTVVLGSVLKSFFPMSKIYAIDPHNGVVGAENQYLQQLPASLENFKQNMASNELTEVVELIKDYSFNVKWERPISLLFIDALHDYENVSKDFHHFSKYLRNGGYVAFHDYAPYYPGVVAFVDELLTTGEYRKVQLTVSLIVLQKVVA